MMIVVYVQKVKQVYCFYYIDKKFNEDIDCTGICFGGFYNCDNFSINFINHYNIYMTSYNNIELQISVTNPCIFKNILLVDRTIVFDYFDQIDHYSLTPSFCFLVWSQDREICLNTGSFSPKSRRNIIMTIPIYNTVTRQIFSKSYSTYSLVMYLYAEGSNNTYSPHILTYNLKYLYCENITSKYECNNMPGCFFCIESIGYNSDYSSIANKYKGKCIDGNKSSDCRKLFHIPNSSISINNYKSILILILLIILI